MAARPKLLVYVTGIHRLCYAPPKAMNPFDILFRTNKFNLSQVKDHFINPCCFGEDLAAWLAPKLREKGVRIRDPYQEDWGWELPVSLGDASYYLCMSGNSDELPGDMDLGEWRIIVQKRRSLLDRIANRGTIQPDDPMLAILQQMLSSDPAIREVRLGDE